MTDGATRRDAADGTERDSVLVLLDLIDIWPGPHARELKLGAPDERRARGADRGRNTCGAFDVENKGVALDIEIWNGPAAVRQGDDPQLERAIAVAVEALTKNRARAC